MGYVCYCLYRGYYAILVIIGIILVSAIRPGEWDKEQIARSEDKERKVLSADTLMDLLR